MSLLGRPLNLSMPDPANTADLENIWITNVNTFGKEKGKSKGILFHYLIQNLKL